MPKPSQKTVTLKKTTVEEAEVYAKAHGFKSVASFITACVLEKIKGA